MKRVFDFTVQITYDGVVQVEAENLPEAESRVRELVKPQGVFCKELFGENETFKTDAFPTVHFLHHSEIPNTETPLSPPPTKEELDMGKCSWCQHCTNELCCLHGTDSLASHCSNYKEEKHGIRHINLPAS